MLRVDYEAAGRALLHSALGDSRLWVARSRRFATASTWSRRTCPGCGTSRCRPSRSRSSIASAELLPASLVGNSFGGGIALRTALAHPGASRPAGARRLGHPGLGVVGRDARLLRARGGGGQAGDLDAATEVNMEFWVAPEHRDEVRPQHRRSLELQTAHDEPEVQWPELAAARDAHGADTRGRRRPTTRTTSARSRSTSPRTSRAPTRDRRGRRAPGRRRSPGRAQRAAARRS